MQNKPTFRLRSTAPEISADDPFKNDLIGRRKLAEFMAQLVGNAEDSFVLALDAPWGTGKTTFLHMWLEEIKKDGSPAVYFNAWENDFAADPLACLLGEVGALLKEIGGKGHIQPQLEKVKKLGARLLKRAIPVGTRLLTAGLVDEETFKDVHDAVSDLTEKVAEEAIAEHEESKKLSSEFRNALTKTVAAISEETSEKHRPLIFVIDELDRCRPTFAVELLERAKHFFTVPGVIFILGVDKMALSTSLQTIYGTGFDSMGYLRRFIDFELPLPAAKSDAFVQRLIEQFGLAEYSAELSNEMARTNYLRNNLAAFFDAAKLPLRAQEQTIVRFSVLLRVTNLRGLLPLAILPLVALMASAPNLYHEFLNGALDGEQLIKRWALSSRQLMDFLTANEQGRRFGIFLNVAGGYIRGENMQELADQLYPESQTSENKHDHEDFLWMVRVLHSRQGVESILRNLDLAMQFSS
jgi:hypothetical protein